MMHELYRDDCFSLMPKLAARSFDAIVADVQGWQDTSTAALLWHNIKRLVKPEGVVVLLVDDEQSFRIQRVELSVGRCVWNGGTPMRQSSSLLLYRPQYQGDETASFYVGYAGPSACVPHAGSSLHPQQKPVELMQELLRAYTKEGDRILDFCMGSGSTGIAAVQLDRYFVGIEIEKAHYDAARMRIGLAAMIHQTDHCDAPGEICIDDDPDDPESALWLGDDFWDYVDAEPFSLHVNESTASSGVLLVDEELIPIGRGK